MQVASLRERLLAGVVDAALVVLGVGAVAGLAVGAVSVYGRFRGGFGEIETHTEDVAAGDFACDSDEVDDERGQAVGVNQQTPAFLQSPLQRAALRGASAGFAVASRNWRSPGRRLVGLRRVDARTRGPVSVRSVLIGAVVSEVQQAAGRRLFQSQANRERDRLGKLAPRLKEIDRAYGTDLHARERARMEFYKENRVNALAGCGWRIAGPMLVQLTLTIAIRDGRTAYDRLTGTIVVTDRGQLPM